MSDITTLALLADFQRQIKEVQKLSGPTGPQGEKGDMGEQGPQGRDGPRGLPGAEGPRGAQGERGEDGKDGEDGVGVQSAYMAADGDLVFTLTDGTEHSVELPLGLSEGTESHTRVVHTVTDTGGNGSGGTGGGNSAAIEALDDRVTINEGDIVTLDERVTINEGDINNLDVRVTTNEGDIGDLDVRLTNNEGDINNIQLQLSTLDGDNITGVRTTGASDQILTSGAFNILDYDQANYNTEPANFSIGTNGRITVSQAGIYSITAGCTIQASLLSALSATALGITVNANLIAFQSNETTLAAGETRGHSVATTFQLSAGDVVDARAAAVSVQGLGNILAILLPFLFGINATQVNHLSLTRVA